MNEFLTVRLSSQLDAPIEWLVWSTEQHDIIASGELASRSELSELAAYADQRTTIVLLSASDLVLTQVEIPAGGSRQFESMLPYLLEDEIAQDVDDLHFTVLNKRDGIAHVAGIDRQWFRQCLADFHDAGIEIKRVMPDVLALPTSDTPLVAAQLGARWLVRKGTWSGMVMEADWLPLLVESDWVRDDQEFLALTSYTPLPALSLHDNQPWHVQPSDMIMQLLAQGAIASRLNLLTGAFKPSSSWHKYWQVWRLPVYSAVALLVLSLAYSAIQANKYEEQAQAYRQESKHIFRTVFPAKHRVPTVSYLKRQFTSEINVLSGSSTQEGVLEWIRQLPTTIGSVEDMTVISLKYDADKGQLRVDATSKDFQSFEKARVKLEQAFSVEQGQLNKDGDTVLGSFVLKAK
ncbi:type II secretion system protein GspL [Vibrio palustris]|uniref:Type II secretion system protein L n=1 Tax=Vibrio palustris TaxID=1918946 RepID=A0A1R4B793_9VIBR|nr:type II secretion system protein GspL [Vibrio palustris]SJL84785.1 Type II secretion system protein L [Vibrio palustris]